MALRSSHAVRTSAHPSGGRLPRSAALVGVCLGALLVTLACGGEGAIAGTGGASATGGVAAESGGATSSGGNASGGSSPSGGSSSGGGSASTGGSSSGSGGEAAADGWEEVRCFQRDGATLRYCYGRLGNLWATVAPSCAFEGEAKEAMDLNRTDCAGEDDPAEWDETWCDEVYCYGRLGDWSTVLTVECDPFPYPSIELEGTPSEVYCEEEEAPTGWGFLGCLVSDGGLSETYCFGSRGLYVPQWGLLPTCEVEASTVGYPEVTPDPEYCPDPE